MKKIVFLISFIALVFVGLRGATEIYMAKLIGISSNQVIEVKKGSNLTALATGLARQGVIQYPRVFVKLGQYYGYANKLRYGEYELNPEMSYRDLLEKIISGDNYRYPVTLVEGDHMYDLARNMEVAGLFDKNKFLNYVMNPQVAKKLVGEPLESLEGYLFPDTYHFSKSDDMETVVKTMVEKFLSATKSLNMRANGLSRHQNVTLASIIEKETGAGFERPLISSVFHNRLKKKMRLQTDPTIIYGILRESGREISNIRKKDILKRTDYNTYTIKGLPPGPIGNPGLAAIKAALAPEKSQFLYFVSQNDGTHIFTKTYKDHLKAVKKFQLNPKARQGKSWRDLKKKVKK